MPIFKKITDEKEITSCGTYLAVSKIGGKYYTLKAPGENRFSYYMPQFDAVEITPNDDGTFPCFDGEDVLTLKTSHTAACRALDAGLPRYSLGTTLNGIPYVFSSEGYGGATSMESYDRTKYGFRMSMQDDGTVAIASVYNAYWGGGSTGKGDDNEGIFTAYEGTTESEAKRFFTFKTQNAYANDSSFKGVELSTYPVELYKLVLVGTEGDKNYIVSDAQSMVTIGGEFTVISPEGSQQRAELRKH